MALAALLSFAGLGAPASAATASTPSGRGVPADGKVMMVMGQDSDTLSDYRTDVLGRQELGAPAPGGVTLYTNLVLGGSPAPLAGMNGPVNWGAGTVDFARTMNEYPGAAVAVGLYLSDATSGCNNQPLRAIIGRNDADVTAGSPNLITQYRAKVDEMINRFKSYDRDILLRIGYEFDGPWNCYSADFYKDAFRYIKGRIDALGASRVATVWQSAAWPVNTSTDHPEWGYVVTDPKHFDNWYPGDAYVDWVGLSAFYNSRSVRTQWGCGSHDTDPVGLQNRVLVFARSHGKSAMVAEAAPQGARTGAGSTSCIFTNSPAPASGQAIWDGWHAGYFDWVNTNKDVIRAAAYINTNWDSQTQWQCSPGAQAGGPGCANGNWGDSRVQANATVLNNFVAEIKKPLWSTGSSGTTDPTDPTDPTNPTDPTDPTDPGDGGSGTEPTYTQSVVTSPATAIRFTTKNFEASFVTVQYRIDGGAPQNYFLTYDQSAKRWEIPVTVPHGATLTYSFNYQPTTQTSQITTPVMTWTAP
ncbi:glycoside hydrolase family 26 protein [Streptomyces sp. CB02460]|uniref:glycoside hydrolase family 26 protein n=1 Tax=Streptomyces sp. CB02460 TaxID=1703941 RepID=UPI000AEC313F|nr:glycoside hydrolase family 26 protein [Streptomyces sp. CB02460]